MGAVTFDINAFLARYPEFSAVNPVQLGAFFNEAGLYLNNTSCSPVQDLGIRALLLNMLTAHIAKLAGVLTADGQPVPVGILSQAAEGSVNATFLQVPPTPGTGAWFQQTPYGAAYWQATTSLRGMQYVPPQQGRFPYGWPRSGC